MGQGATKGARQEREADAIAEGIGKEIGEEGGATVPELGR